MSKAYQRTEPDKGSMLDEKLFPPYRVMERKIGKATFTVYSWFSKGKEKDVVSTFARLMLHDTKMDD